jgi:hypothetical protein
MVIGSTVALAAGAGSSARKSQELNSFEPRKHISVSNTRKSFAHREPVRLVRREGGQRLVMRAMLRGGLSEMVMAIVPTISKGSSYEKIPVQIWVAKYRSRQKGKQGTLACR